MRAAPVLTSITVLAIGLARGDAAAAPTAPPPQAPPPARAAQALAPPTSSALLGLAQSRPAGLESTRVLESASKVPAGAGDVLVRAGVDRKRVEGDLAAVRDKLRGASSFEERKKLVDGFQATWAGAEAKVRGVVGEPTKLAPGAQISSTDCQQATKLRDCATDGDVAYRLLGGSGAARVRGLGGGALALSAVPASPPPVPDATQLRSRAPFPVFDARPALRSEPRVGAYTNVYVSGGNSTERKTVAIGSWFDVQRGHRRVRISTGIALHIQYMAIAALGYASTGATIRVAAFRDPDRAGTPLCQGEATWGFYVPVAGGTIAQEWINPVVACGFDRPADADMDRVFVGATVETWATSGGIGVSDNFTSGTWDGLNVTTSRE
ncbi:MAG: hypothetical protein JST00_36450 [Deltaproteobacteria bacterium]|nr:hypothetical protein [Deltaproteobacteria bacterium]